MIVSSSEAIFMCLSMIFFRSVSCGNFDMASFSDVAVSFLRDDINHILIEGKLRQSDTLILPYY